MGARKAQYFIREHYDRPVSKREFVRLQREEIETFYIGQKQIVEHKILSIRKIREAEKAGHLTSIRHKGRKYLKREEVSSLLNEPNAKPAQKTSQLGLFRNK